MLPGRLGLIGGRNIASPQEELEKQTELLVRVAGDETNEVLLSEQRSGGKSCWDWMSLLVVPPTLFFCGAILALYQDNRQNTIEDARATRENETEETRWARQNHIEASRVAAQTSLQGTTEADRANADALQAYLDDMTVIILDRDLSDATVRTTAKARTTSILRKLNRDRRNAVASFLRDAGLLVWILDTTDLSGANLSGTNLTGANLSRANLFQADLTEVTLYQVSLTGGLPGVRRPDRGYTIWGQPEQGQPDRGQLDRNRH